MSALNTIDLNQILQRNPITKKVYLGTYPACEIPKSRKKRYCFITNTDQHDEPGTHWTAWMVEGDNVEFFDSFGRPPNDFQMPYEFKKYILGKKVSYSTLRVQEFSSSTCGYFCIYYIYFRSMGLDYKYIIKELLNLYDNDDIVITFFNSLLD